MQKVWVVLCAGFLFFPSFAKADFSVNSTTGNVGVGTTAPIVALDASHTTDAIALPVGTTANRPTGLALTNGEIRYNSSTQGVEAYVNGAWVALGAGGVGGSICGRLTGQSNTPVPASDINGATTLYYADAAGAGGGMPCDTVSVYNGASWVSLALNGQISLSLDDNAAHTGYQAAGNVFDVFVYNNNGAPALVTGPAWSSPTARSAAISLQNGIWVNASSMTAKYDTTLNTYTCAAHQCTYVGSIAVPGASTTLAAAISSTTATAITVASAVGSPTVANWPVLPQIGSYYVLIDSEVMQVTAGAGTTNLTVVRGARGTVAATHANGATVSVDSGQLFADYNPTSISGALGTNNMAFIYNAYNRVQQTYTEAQYGSFSYSTSAYQRANNTPTNSIYFLDGLGQSPLSVMYTTNVQNSAAASGANTGVNLDATTTQPPYYATFTAMAAGATGRQQMEISANFLPVLGVHYVAPIVYCNGGACTFGFPNPAGMEFVLSYSN